MAMSLLELATNLMSLGALAQTIGGAATAHPVAWTASREYDFVELELRQPAGEVVCHCKFEVRADATRLTEVHCADQARVEAVQKAIVELHWAWKRMEQNNRNNARSSDHRDDYTMRDLALILPLGNEAMAQPRFGEERIGELVVQFSDGSSSQHKTVGD
jgi:hypothetical protein